MKCQPYFHILLSPSIFKDTNDIIDSRDRSGSHISKFNRDLPYDNAAISVKRIKAFQRHRVFVYIGVVNQPCLNQKYLSFPAPDLLRARIAIFLTETGRMEFRPDGSN